MGQILAEMSSSLHHKDIWVLHTATSLLIQHHHHADMPRAEVALLCLKSAQASVSNTDYTAAAVFTDAGINMLQPDPWSSYDLALELFSLSAETHRCALDLS